MASIMEQVEFIDDGKKVIIPKELWDKIVEALEDYLLGRLAKERLKDLDQAVEVSLDEL